MFGLVLSILLLYDSKLKFNGEDGILSTQAVKDIALFNRILILILAIIFLLTIIEGSEIAKSLDAFTESLDLQLIAAWITLIPAILTLLAILSATNEATDTLNPEL